MNNQEKVLGLEEELLIADYIQRLGSAASIALLNPACKFFNISNVDGLIGYRDEARCAIVLGDPVCAFEDAPQLVHEFHAHCAQQKKSIIYAMVSAPFTDWALENQVCRSAMEIGDEIIIDPMRDVRSESGPYPHLLRQKEKHAARSGLVAQEYTGNDAQLEQKLERVAHAWLQGRNGPQIYLLEIDIFADRTNKRWFYVTQGDEVVGVLMLNRIAFYQGWVMNGSLMVTDQAPNSASEFMMLYALEVLRNEGCTFLSIGPTPAHQIGRIEGLGHISRWMTRSAFKVAQKIFKLSDRQRYWKKFHPRKEPTFVLFSSPRIGIRELRAIIRAFNVNI
jgi:lysylphosphatidylglycerol synthetase-like protein (DUF2156 family)